MIDFLNSMFSGPLMVVFITFVGVLLTFKTKAAQLRFFNKSLHTIFKPAKSDKNSISPFQALTTALSGTLGTGNITGVALAVSVGGAGAIFWMWISAFLGMIIKYSEIALSVKNKVLIDNKYSGGPMYYLRKLKFGKALSFLFCVACVFSSFGIGNMTQSSTATVALSKTFSLNKYLVAFVIMLLTFFVIIGGIKRIAKTTQFFIPVMSAFYIFACLFIVFTNFNEAFSAFVTIFKSAFNFKSVLGGTTGYTLILAVKTGFTRGVFTNEAGLGSAPIAYSASSENSPHKQGLWGIFEVFFDTIVMCTLTAVVIIMSKNYSAITDGTVITINAFSKYLGSIASGFIAVSTAFFATSTVISWNYYGEQSLKFLIRNIKADTIKTKIIFFYKLVYVVLVFVGGIISADFVWKIADVFNGFMMLPNIIGIILLSDEVKNIVKKENSREKSLQ